MWTARYEIPITIMLLCNHVILGSVDYQELLGAEDEDDYAAPAEVLMNNESPYLSQKPLGATPLTAIGI